MPADTSDSTTPPLAPVLAPGPQDPELARVVAAWPALPSHVRQAIATLIASAVPGMAQGEQSDAATNRPLVLSHGGALMRAKTLGQADALTVRARRLLYDHRARAKRDGAALAYGLADVRQLLESSPCCLYCGLPVAWDVQLDHRQPIARGGKHVLDNLAVCCQRCNSLKGQLLESEFRALLVMLSGLHPVARQDVERRLLAGGRRYALSRGPKGG